jgi:hypothetical protein
VFEFGAFQACRAHMDGDAVINARKDNAGAFERHPDVGRDLGRNARRLGLVLEPANGRFADDILLGLTLKGFKIFLAVQPEISLVHTEF